MVSLREVPDLATVNPDDGRGLFDVIVRRDTNFKTGDDYNVDPDFEQFSILCHSYFLMNNTGLMTMNYESANHCLDKAAEKMDGEKLYFNIIQYNKDGTEKSSQVLSGRLLCMAPTVSSDSVLNKMFVFGIEH